MATSLSEDQIEDILGQLQARRRQSPATQLSLEEQKLLMSLEHLNNKLKCKIWPIKDLNQISLKFNSNRDNFEDELITFWYIKFLK